MVLLHNNGSKWHPCWWNGSGQNTSNYLLPLLPQPNWLSTLGLRIWKMDTQFQCHWFTWREHRDYFQLSPASGLWSMHFVQDMFFTRKSTFNKFSFKYIVINKAHHIENILSQIIRSFVSHGQQFITSTPLQNSLKELFTLLNFICHEIFVNYADLDSHKDVNDEGVQEVGERSKKVMEVLHMIQRPFLLRRVKGNVEKNSLPK